MNLSPVLVIMSDRVEIPPPAARLEELKQQRRVVASAYEALVVLKVLPLEIQFDPIGSVDGVIELNQHLLLRMTNEIFASQVAILGQSYLKLIC